MRTEKISKGSWRKLVVLCSCRNEGAFEEKCWEGYKLRRRELCEKMARKTINSVDTPVHTPVKTPVKTPDQLQSASEVETIVCRSPNHDRTSWHGPEAPWKTCLYTSNKTPPSCHSVIHQHHWGFGVSVSGDDIEADVKLVQEGKRRLERRVKRKCYSHLRHHLWHLKTEKVSQINV